MIILKGDLLETPFEIIAHQVNCRGKMGSGVAKQIRGKFPVVYEDYARVLETYGAGVMFGRAQVVYQDVHTIFNLFGQLNYGYDGKQYTDYKALENALDEAIWHYRHDQTIDSDVQLTIAIPYKIGCDRGGGDWDVVKGILEKIEKECHVIFVAYKLEE